MIRQTRCPVRGQENNPLPEMAGSPVPAVDTAAATALDRRSVSRAVAARRCIGRSTGLADVVRPVDAVNPGAAVGRCAVGRRGCVAVVATDTVEAARRHAPSHDAGLTAGRVGIDLRVEQQDMAVTVGGEHGIGGFDDVRDLISRTCRRGRSTSTSTSRPCTGRRSSRASTAS
jgi:hypothetical protein